MLPHRLHPVSGGSQYSTQDDPCNVVTTIPLLISGQFTILPFLDAGSMSTHLYRTPLETDWPWTISSTCHFEGSYRCTAAISKILSTSCKKLTPYVIPEGTDADSDPKLEEASLLSLGSSCIVVASAMRHVAPCGNICAEFRQDFYGAHFTYSTLTEYGDTEILFVYKYCCILKNAHEAGPRQFMRKRQLWTFRCRAVPHGCLARVRGRWDSGCDKKLIASPHGAQPTQI